MAPFLRQKLATMGLGQAVGTLNRQFPGTALAVQKGGDRIAVFFGQHRAGGIDQNAAHLEGLPECVQQFALQRGECRYVFGLPGQLDVRVAANHAGGRTGRIQQDALERRPVPPGRQLAGIGGLERGRQAQALQVLAHPLQASGFQIEGDQLGQGRRALENLTGLAPRGAAGIQYPLPWLELQQRRRQLGRFILHTHLAAGKAG